MTHLADYDLARLVDEAPSHAERDHLARCAACASRIAAMRSTTSVLAALPAPALSSLADERLRRRIPELRRERGSARRALRFARLAAAAVVIFAAGVLAGRETRPRFETPARLPAPSASTALTAPPRANPDNPALDTLPTLRMASSANVNATVRLAALESVVRSTELALRAAPGDSLLVRLHRAAATERSRAWQQLTVARGGLWF